jgi:pimeloyl-ACP methyl ester carboxylesterase
LIHFFVHVATAEAYGRPLGPGDIVIATLQDAAIDPDWQIHTARTHGARLIELDSGHWPFLTQPAELASILSSLD